jgi:hypothetical protein
MLISCSSNEPFNKNGWLVKDDIGNYPEREKMLNDLMESHLNKIHYNSAIKLLGNPDAVAGSVLSYNILTDYGSDIDPVYTKNLDISFKDSIVNHIKIVEKKY